MGALPLRASVRAVQGGTGSSQGEPPGLQDAAGGRRRGDGWNPHTRDDPGRESMQRGATYQSRTISPIAQRRRGAETGIRCSAKGLAAPLDAQCAWCGDGKTHLSLTDALDFNQDIRVDAYKLTNRACHTQHGGNAFCATLHTEHSAARHGPVFNDRI